MPSEPQVIRPQDDVSNGETDVLAEIQPTTRRNPVRELAFQFWTERGCPEGSPEDDWFRAERELRSRPDESE